MASAWPLLLLAAVAVTAAPPPKSGEKCALKDSSICGNIQCGKQVYNLGPLAKEVTQGPFTNNWMTSETGTQDKEEYNYYMNPCGGITSPNNNFRNASVVQIPLDSTDGKEVTKDATSCGYAGSADVFTIRDGDIRWKATGESCSNNDSRISEVIFVCSRDYELGSPFFIDEIAHCYYLFLWSTCAACPVGSKYRDGCGQSSASTPSAGTLFLIILVVGSTCYLVFGVLFKRFVGGERGLEMIPNIHFWLDVGEYIMAGFRFVFCCNDRSKISISADSVIYHPGPSGAKAEQGLGDEEEVDGDAEDLIYD